MNDIKQVLTTAFKAEPPVRIDRAQLIKNGRRRLLRRRMATTGGTVLAAVVVGTTVFVGVGQPEQLQPGAPPPTPPTPSTSSSRPTTSPSPRPPLSAGVAQQFTKVLAESRIVPAELALRAPTESGRALQFEPERNHYEAAADLVDRHGNEGTLYVMVADSRRNDARPTCAAPNTCVQREFGGRSVQLTTVPFSSRGEVLLIAHTRLPNGTQVYAMTSNVSTNAVEQHGKAKSPPTTPHHLVTLDQLGQIVGLAELKL
ncbi:hypothetical protein KIPE111705_21170 [Kibdelosporangium persicum]|uniref:Uncharacterized protein n=1 Tax=Kibdelosporangium persicum TaxID=2698649 RepID=A0ABX2FHN1_9PSEU|nr:hypothetical protein [Kibdelosporangium persicum]NRN70370.1 hypothetical protein [Kibdelosporangium persicum]